MAISYFLSVDEAEQAACKQVDLDVFFPIGQKYLHLETAQQTCARCPFTERCADYARENDLIGFWGGTTGKERGRYHENR